MSQMTRVVITPLQRYQNDINKGLLVPDEAQRQAVAHLQRLYGELFLRQGGRFSVLDRVIRLLVKKSPPPVRGLYFWGGVGRGKTYLMDAFYDSLPGERKMRAHFHRFMQMVHRQLKQLAGSKNPLESIADDLATKAQVLCFDEFFVSDIADAMILGTLMQGLFSRGVVLVATSNIIPDQLYKDGLQRQRFLPVIDLIKTHTEIVNVDGGVDYRLRVLQRAEIYHSPLDDRAEQSLMKSFNQLIPDPASVKIGGEIEIENRMIKTVRCEDDVVWFEFAQLCGGPRSQNDYIEIARIYHAVLLGKVPQLSSSADDQARRLVNLVDEFYDRNVKLIMSAAQEIDSLYTGERLKFEFERTKSRLREMQSHAYLARAHKP